VRRCHQRNSLLLEPALVQERRLAPERGLELDLAQERGLVQVRELAQEPVLVPELAQLQALRHHSQRRQR
jgi:hypothetical protein